MSAILQLGTHLGWVGQKDYSYMLAKALLYLHTHFYTLFHNSAMLLTPAWFVIHQISTAFSPFLLTLPSQPFPTLDWSVWLFLTKDKLLHKPYRLTACFYFRRLWMSKNTLNLTLVFQGVRNPFQLGDICRPNAHVLWPVIWAIHETGYGLWQTPVESRPEWQSSQYSPPKSLVPVFFTHRTTLSKFCFSRNGLKQEENTVGGRIPRLSTRRQRLNMANAPGGLRHQKSTFWRTKSLWKTVRTRRTQLANNAALTVRWKRNIWSFSKGKGLRGFSASWLPGISFTES